MARAKGMRRPREPPRFGYQSEWWVAQTRSGKRIKVEGNSFNEVKANFLAAMPNAKEIHVFETKTGKASPIHATGIGIARPAKLSSHSSAKSSSSSSFKSKRSSLTRKSTRSSSSSSHKSLRLSPIRSAHSSKSSHRSPPRRYVSPRSPVRVNSWNGLNGRLVRVSGKANNALHRLDSLEQDVRHIEKYLGLSMNPFLK